MASNVTVDLDGFPLKKVVIKTTPAMSLKSITAQACEKLGLGDPDKFLLKSKKQTLDLSLSVRFANLAPGAKLTLHRRTAADAPVGSQQVDIALQLDEGGRVTGRFETSTTLWEILVHFETKSGGSLNITKRTGVPPSGAKGLAKALEKMAPKAPVYILPACVFMNQEYNTIERLKTTTLSKAGLESGNGVIRISGKYMDAPLDAFLDEINAATYSNACPNAGSNAGPISLPASFFKLSPLELKALVASQQARNKQIADAPLMTRAMREREEEARRQKHPKTMIRVRFPEQLTLQATFWSGDRVSELYATVREHLAQPERAFALYVAPPHRELPGEATFWEAQLAPASVVHFAWVNRDGAAALSSAAAAMAREFPLRIEEPAGAMADAAVPLGDDAAAALAAADAAEAQRELERERERQRSGHAGGSVRRADDDEDGGGLGGGGSRGLKMPRWFRGVSGR
nr:Tether containing UBX domain for GLUT4 [Polyrhizophydium stewartii]